MTQILMKKTHVRISKIKKIYKSESENVDDVTNYIEYLFLLLLFDNGCVCLRKPINTRERIFSVVGI